MKNTIYYFLLLAIFIGALPIIAAASTNVALPHFPSRPPVQSSVTGPPPGKPAGSLKLMTFKEISAYAAKASKIILGFAAVALFLFYISLARRLVTKSLVKKIRREETQLSEAGISSQVKAYHPAVLTIRKWMEMPAAPSERAHLWLDANINEVFGPLISRGELLRVICLNVSFGGTILAFLATMTTGQDDLSEMFREFSAALGMTLVALVLVTLESWTLSTLSMEAERLEYTGREMLETWHLNRQVATGAEKQVTLAEAAAIVKEEVSSAEKK